MTASADDKFMYVGDPGTATNLAGSGYTIGDPSITVDTTTGWPTATGVIFGIDTVTIENGQEVRDEGSYCIFAGVVTSATTIGSVSKLFGTDQDYSAGASTRVYITVSAYHTKRLIEGLLAEHSQLDGIHALGSSATLTSSKIITALNDTNGNELLKVTPTASAVNELTFANAATGNSPTVTASGGDTNVGMNFVPKGTGKFQIGGNPIDHGAWASWIPTWTNLSVGDGTVDAKYVQIGKTVHFRLFLTIGGGSAIGTEPTFSLPSASIFSGTMLQRNIIGQAHILDEGSAAYAGIIRIKTASTASVWVIATSGTYSQITPVTASIPHGWAATDTIAVTGTYEAA